MNRNIEVLIKRAKRGNEQALEEIARMFQTELYRFCYYLTRQESLAQDLCQDTFLYSLSIFLYMLSAYVLWKKNSYVYNHLFQQILFLFKSPPIEVLED